MSNAIALTVLGLAWKVPTVGRISPGVIFLLASIVNTYTVLTTPVADLLYKDFAVLEIYRQFIDGWFTSSPRFCIQCRTSCVLTTMAVISSVRGLGDTKLETERFGSSMSSLFS